MKIGDEVAKCSSLRSCCVRKTNSRWLARACRRPPIAMGLRWGMVVGSNTLRTVSLASTCTRGWRRECRFISLLMVLSIGNVIILDVDEYRIKAFLFFFASRERLKLHLIMNLLKFCSLHSYTIYPANHNFSFGNSPEPPNV